MARLSPTEARALSNVIRMFRGREDLSQERVEERAGLSSGYLTELEGGRRSPSFATVYRVTRGLGVSLNEFTEAFEREVERANRSTP